MIYDNKILVGKSGQENVYLYPSMANRHGLIAGATGTGKTVSLKVLAESFSELGVSVFLADAKGDLAGTALLGQMSDNIAKRVNKLGLDELGFELDSFPVSFWDLYQKRGIALRTTISEMGPLLLSRILNLNNVQSDILTIVFKIADEENLLLIDSKDLKAILQYIGENADKYALEYGNMSKQSIASIIRAISSLEASGGEAFFAEPALDISGWFLVEANKKGRIHILDCQELMLNPRLYASFLLWMISELYESLPEIGDLDKPKMVFFFDEAHLLFDEAPKVLLDKISQMVKLIRSKGVGIYFVTQNPRDIPDEVLAQLSNKIVHAIRAYTPKEQKALKSVAEAFRANEEFDTEEELANLGIGEALVSCLNEEGIPTVVKKTKILPPKSFMGAIDDNKRRELIASDKLNSKYANYVDNDSAYEFLERLKAKDRNSVNLEGQCASPNNPNLDQGDLMTGTNSKPSTSRDMERKSIPKTYERNQSTSRKASRTLNRTLQNSASSVGREIGRSLGDALGGKVGKRLGANIGASLGRGLLDTFLKF